MTSIATAVGVVPLVVAGGPGSASRATNGVVVIFGVAFSTLLSLFVVPVYYALLAPYMRSPDAVAQELEVLAKQSPSVGGHALRKAAFPPGAERAGRMGRTKREQTHT